MRLRIDPRSAVHRLRVQKRRRARLQHVVDQHDEIRQQRQVALLNVKGQHRLQTAARVGSRGHHGHFAAQQNIFQPALRRHLPEPRDGRIPQHEAARQPLAQRRIRPRALHISAHQPLAQHHADLARRTRRVEQPDRAVLRQLLRQAAVKGIDVVCLKRRVAPVLRRRQLHPREGLQRLLPEIRVFAHQQHARRADRLTAELHRVILRHAVLRADAHAHIRKIIYLPQQQGHALRLALRAVYGLRGLLLPVHAQFDFLRAARLAVNDQLKAHIRASAKALHRGFKRRAVDGAAGLQRAEAHVPLVPAAQGDDLQPLRLRIRRVRVQPHVRNAALVKHLLAQRRRARHVARAPAARNALQRRAKLRAAADVIRRNARLVPGQHHRHARAPRQPVHVALRRRHRAGKARLSAPVRHLHARRSV